MTDLGPSARKHLALNSTSDTIEEAIGGGALVPLAGSKVANFVDKFDDSSGADPSSTP